MQNDEHFKNSDQATKVLILNECLCRSLHGEPTTVYE
jgi:hypothetical protein